MAAPIYRYHNEPVNKRDTDDRAAQSTVASLIVLDDNELRLCESTRLVRRSCPYFLCISGLFRNIAFIEEGSHAVI